MIYKGRAAGLHFEGADYKGRSIIINAAEISPNCFEVMALYPDGQEIEVHTEDNQEAAASRYAAMLSYHTTGNAPGAYSMDDWQLDGDFNAFEGQEVAPEVYEEMLNALPPLSLSNKTKEGVSSGFLMGEPSASDAKGLLFMAFGIRNGHHFFLGFRHAE